MILDDIRCPSECVSYMYVRIGALNQTYLQGRWYIIRNFEVMFLKMNHDSCECFFNNKEEEEFLFSLLNCSIDVLEWGSGMSTISIASRANFIHSIEHNKQWYDRMRLLLPKNARLHYIVRNKEEAKGHDGTEQDYYNYVHYPETLGKKFDIILIDGRARVACARVAIDLLRPGGSVLIHDIFNPDHKCDRKEYWDVLNFLHPIKGEYALWQFKPKRNL